MRKALLAAAMTSGLVAASRRRPPAAPPAEDPPVPAQRRTRLVDGDAELIESEQDAQDAAILALLDRL
jgi:hypothetical protein